MYFFCKRFSKYFQKNFICRSAEYNYVTLQCRLSDYDRRSVSEDFQAIQLTEAQGVDYFENLCLNSKYEVKEYYLVSFYLIQSRHDTRFIC